MANSRLSPEQTKIIEAPLNKDILVNAGAGSGKTFVLKQRVAKLLADNEITTSELLVLTFTNNSAHDMKTKIVEEISNLKSDKLSDDKIEVIKNAINSAHIQTFDSFAQEIVTFYASKLNLPNTLFIADEYVLEAKKKEFIEEIFNSKYANNDQTFINFISKYNIRDDKKTQQVLSDLYDQIERLSPLEKENVIDRIKSNFNNKDFFSDCWNKYKEEWIKEQTKAILKSKSNVDKASAIAKLEKKVEVEAGEKDKEWEKYSLQQKDALYLLDLYCELKKLLDEYKIKSNTYTFTDIANKALFLLQNFPEVAAEIRNKYKYIMVDEYQDTNDIQEAVINILLEPKEDGSRSHLFCVGDAKQSIYSFRNANINIFFDREYELNQIEDPNKAEVIAMSSTFRSFKEVIDDINRIFFEYMTLTHGGIEYNNQSQRLQLAPLHSDWTQKEYINKNNNKPAEFGLHIITTDNKQAILHDPAGARRRWECKAIIQDINTKVNNHYQVWDDTKCEFRDCDYGDFYILVRTKGNYRIYEEEFKKAGINLNNQIESNLIEVNPNMFINSLINYFALIESNDTSKKAYEKKKHIFASIARSYVFKGSIAIFEGEENRYNDQYILDRINDGSFINDPIFKALDSFYECNKNLPFSKFFIEMINVFEIMHLIFEVGEVEKNTAKIESLYKLIQSIEQAGGGIKSFSHLLEIISKHRIELSDISVTDLNNTVTLMTIHQSKGLQNKIVYLPNSVNHVGGNSNMNKPEYDFDKEFGILLPDYNLNDYRNEKENNEFYQKGGCIYTIPHKLFRIINKQNLNNINEHVRLFYVALTRAVQAIYIVGYPECDEAEDGKLLMDERKHESLFGMLSYVWGEEIFPYDNKSFPQGKWHMVNISKQDPIGKNPLIIQNVDDKKILFDSWSKKKASQLPTIYDKEIMEQQISKGNELHSIMERIDLNNPNLDFINNETYKLIIEKVVNMPLFKSQLKGAQYFHEYEYYDDLYHNNAYIDLLAIKDGMYYIIDWKLSNLEKQAYEKQLHIYQKNIQKIFNIDSSKIKLILVSLEKQKTKEIEVE